MKADQILRFQTLQDVTKLNEEGEEKLLKGSVKGVLIIRSTMIVGIESSFSDKTGAVLKTMCTLILENGERRRVNISLEEADKMIFSDSPNKIGF